MHVASFSEKAISTSGALAVPIYKHVGKFSIVNIWHGYLLWMELVSLPLENPHIVVFKV